jgi:hypothetical protein
LTPQKAISIVNQSDLHSLHLSKHFSPVGEKAGFNENQLTLLSLKHIISPTGEITRNNKNIMKEFEIIDRVQQGFKELLLDIPFLAIERTGQEILQKNIRADILFEIRANNRLWKIVIEAKSVGEPRQARYAIQQLREYLATLKDAYGVIAAPYISDGTANLCKENGVGYIDLAGNCFLSFDQVFIERRNYPNPNVEKRQLRSIFTPKASRILRVMLTNPGRPWKLEELGNEAKVSLGLAFKVKERLLDLEYAREENKRILLNRPFDLIDKWADNYSFRRNKLYDYFSLEQTKKIEQRLAEYCQGQRIPYALTLFSGAAMVAPFARYTRGFAYVSSEIQKLASSISLKEVSSGPNFTILEPYDEGVFYENRRIEGMDVVCDIQLYLDLIGYKGRGDESAKFLLEQRIKPQW